MFPPPVVLGLSVCDRVMVEEGSRQVSLIGLRKTWRADVFPFTPVFFVQAALTNGSGDVTIDLIVTRLETNEETYSRSTRIHFADKLHEKQVIFRVSSCSFPAPGTYELVLLANREWVAHRRVEILEREEPS